MQFQLQLASMTWQSQCWSLQYDECWEKLLAEASVPLWLLSAGDTGSVDQHTGTIQLRQAVLLVEISYQSWKVMQRRHKRYLKFARKVQFLVPSFLHDTCGSTRLIYVLICVYEQVSLIRCRKKHATIQELLAPKPRWKTPSQWAHCWQPPIAHMPASVMQCVGIVCWEWRSNLITVFLPT